MIFLQSFKIAGTRGGNEFVSFFRTFLDFFHLGPPPPLFIDKKEVKFRVPAIDPVS